MHWEYRQSRTLLPTVAEWGGARVGAAGDTPRLVAALAALHARLGVLPWSQVLQPAIDIARSVSSFSSFYMVN